MYKTLTYVTAFGPGVVGCFVFYVAPLAVAGILSEMEKQVAPFTPVRVRVFVGGGGVETWASGAAQEPRRRQGGREGGREE